MACSQGCQSHVMNTTTYSCVAQIGTYTIKRRIWLRPMATVRSGAVSSYHYVWEAMFGPGGVV